jgi:hypothetical protein
LFPAFREVLAAIGRIAGRAAAKQDHDIRCNNVYTRKASLGLPCVFAFLAAITRLRFRREPIRHMPHDLGGSRSGQGQIPADMSRL